MIIAIQKNGRLTEPSLDFLDSRIGKIAKKKHFRHDYIHTDKNIIVFLRYGDIIKSVTNNIADCGIIGSDSLVESLEEKSDIKSYPLGFSKCKLVLAVPEDSSINKRAELQDKTIVTEFPVITSLYLSKHNIDSKIYKVKGSCEVFSYLGFADAIVDIMETGESLKAYSMKVIDLLMEIEAVLIYKDINKVQKLLLKNQ